MTSPEKVLITGGREVGGLRAFAEGLSEGFTALGIPSEVVPPHKIYQRLHELRDERVLKILSTTGIPAVAVARRAICVAHGFPCPAYQGWVKALNIMASLKGGRALSGAPLVAVSHYTAVHLESVFGVHVDAVIHNPLRSLFFESCVNGGGARDYVTYVGRLDEAKNLHRLIPAVRDLLRETPGLRACFIGDGDQRSALRRVVNGDASFEFTGTLDSGSVRGWLRRTRVFFSGCVVEALGISYLEALSQGCAVAMPACGGGLEVAPGEIGKSVHLLPLSFERSEVLSVLRASLGSRCGAVELKTYSAREVAKAYLRVDSQFSLSGKSLECKAAMPEDELA